LSNARSSPSTRTGDASLRAVFVVALVIVVLYLAREVFIPVAFASLLGMIWTPPVLWLQKRGVNRVVSVMLVAACSLAAAGGIAWVIGNQLIAVVSSLPDYQQNIHNKIAALGAAGKGSISQAAENVQRLGKELSGTESGPPPAAAGSRKTPNAPVTPVPVQIAQPAPNPIQYVATFAVQFVRPLAAAILVLVFSIFLLIERQEVRNRFLRLVGLGQLNVMTQALDDTAQRLSRYFLLQFAVNAGFGFIIGLGLYFVGIPYAALWGAVAALFRIVPYVGALAAAALPAVLSIAAFNTWMPILGVAALFVGTDLVVANWLEPRLYGSHTGVSALAILVTTVFWTILWGPAGLILSTPLTVCVAVFGRYVPQLAFLHILLGDEPVLAAETQVYQRLLAMDREEAQSIAELFLSQHSLLELYDSVILPALGMAEQDRHKGALDGTREEFVFLSVKEMIAEFSNYAPQEGSAAEEHRNARPRRSGALFAWPRPMKPMRSPPRCWRSCWSSETFRRRYFPRARGLRRLDCWSRNPMTESAFPRSRRSRLHRRGSWRVNCDRSFPRRRFWCACGVSAPMPIRLCNGSNRHAPNALSVRFRMRSNISSPLPRRSRPRDFEVFQRRLGGKHTAQAMNAGARRRGGGAQI
jgi:predicted PurR-regulated permease PerM